LLSPDVDPHWQARARAHAITHTHKREKVYLHKIERNIVGVTMKDKVRKTGGKRTSIWNTAAWADTHMEMGRICNINQPITTDLRGYNVDQRIRKRNLWKLNSRWFIVFKKMFSSYTQSNTTH
jgi:hypothetical protein